MGRSAELLQRVQASEAVLGLAGKPRYGMSMDESISPELWIANLDVDFDNMQHLFKTAMLCVCIAEIDESPKVDRYNAFLTGIVHDAPEFIIGDINDNHKTVQHAVEESDTLATIVEQGLLNITPEELAIAQAVMADKETGDPQTEAGIVFNLSERMGYMLSALTAWETAETSTVFGEVQRQKLRWTAGNVMSNQYSIVARYAQAGRKSAQLLLDVRHNDFEDIMEHCLEESTVAMHTDFYHAADLSHKVEAIYQSMHTAHTLHRQNIAC